MSLRFSKPETYTVHVDMGDGQELDIEIEMPEGLNKDQQSIYMDGAAAGVVGFLSQWNCVEVEDDDDSES